MSRGRLVVAALALAGGCGRVGFDVDQAAGDARAETGGNGTCATAAAIEIGGSLEDQVIDASNDVPPWGLCLDGPEVVYQVTVAETTNVSIVATATFSGMISTGSSCPPALLGQSSCYTFTANQLFTRSYPLSAGTTYIIVDKVSGSGSSFEIGLQ